MNDDIPFPFPDELSQAVFAHWMERGQAATRSDIAVRLGWSAGKVSRLIREAKGFVDGCIATDWYGVSGRRSDAWEPSPEALRDTILGLRAKLRAKDEQLRPDLYLEGRDYAESHSN